MPDAVLIVDREGKIIMGNKCVKPLFGYEKQELIGQAIEFLTPFRHSKIYKARYIKFNNNLKAKKMGTRWKLDGRKKDATEFSLEVSLGSFRIKNLAYGIISARDVTTRKREVITLKKL
jgi:protein-histidine pros-kinase